MLIAAGVLVVLTVAGVGAYVLYVKHEGEDIRGSSTVEFTVPVTPPPPPPAPKPQGIVWPTYGYSPQRLRVAPAFDLKPPYRLLWTFHGRTLLEFPPAVAYDRVYLTTFDGRFYALNSKTGKPLWHYFSHRCGWASPAVADGVVYQTYSTTGRGVEFLMPYYGFLDHAPKGRGEGEDDWQLWIRRHDEYDGS